jgi:hypothetical protein
MMTVKEFTIPLVRDVSYYRDEVPLFADIPSLWYTLSPIVVSFVTWGNLKWGGLYLYDSF